ncbi:MAG: AMP-binding protein, partial [Ruminococcus sp.]|nr:AMP-binding protein [Ruminococcus sp.]
MKEVFKQREHLDYPEATMYQMVERMAEKYPDEPAYRFYGRDVSYKDFTARIERCARALTACGIRPGDAVTLCMPNIPQALECFYAVNRIG